MSVRDAFIVSLFGIFGYASLACANSCANVVVLGTYDESGLHESDLGIYATGTFRIESEADESKQPMFNLATVNCKNPSEDVVRVSLECTVIRAVVWARPDAPDTDKPNCSLDLDSSTFLMSELQTGVLIGSETSASTSCFNTKLTIDRNTKMVYTSHTRTKFADNYDQIKPSTCGTPPRTEALMNCTAWPGIRKQGGAMPRYCDFSGSSGK